MITEELKHTLDSLPSEIHESIYRYPNTNQRDKAMLTKGKFLVSFEVPGHTKEYTEGFTEEW